MKVTFLGTGTSHGIPLIGCPCEVCHSQDTRDKRLRCSVMIELNDLVLVIDTGPDFRTQMLQAKPQKLDAVIYTHEHKDHTAGMDDVRAFNFWQEKPIPLYGTDRVLKNLKKSYDYVFGGPPYPGIPLVELMEIDNSIFSIGDTDIIPIQVYHHKLPVMGFRIEDFTYITDANLIPESEKSKIAGSKVLVLNALRNEYHISHYTLEEAIAVGKELHVPEVYFVHMSHQLGFHKEVDGQLPPGFHLAYDGLQIHL